VPLVIVTRPALLLQPPLVLYVIAPVELLVATTVNWLLYTADAGGGVLQVTVGVALVAVADVCT
jgi:hypothetical protein